MISRVTLQPVGKDKFRTAAPFSYKDVEIPAGFISNGANVPRIFWSIFPPNSPEYLSASVVHDYMCANMKNYGYLKADQYLYDAMIDCGVSKWKSKLFYYFCLYRHKVLDFFKAKDGFYTAKPVKINAE